MARSADHDGFLVQGQPIPVRWAGWESDTYRLSRAGWALALNEESCHDQLDVVLHHQALQVTARGTVRGYRELRHRFMRSISGRYGADDYLRHAGIDIEHVGLTQRFELYGRDPFALHEWVDCEPSAQTVSMQKMRLSDMTLFRKLEAPAPQELITDPETVQELLDRIVAMQAPMRKEIRTRSERRERDAPQARRIHAQIVSLPLAA